MKTLISVSSVSLSASEKASDALHDYAPLVTCAFFAMLSILLIQVLLRSSLK
jgi:hypothetical protein